MQSDFSLHYVRTGQQLRAEKIPRFKDMKKCAHNCRVKKQRMLILMGIMNASSKYQIIFIIIVK